MSIKPIINDVNALNNKSLNIIGNSAQVNDLVASGDNVLLKGNQIPSSTTTAGNILVNTDGAGDLQWQSAGQTDIFAQSSFSPNFVVAGGTFLSGDARYQRIDNYITIWGSLIWTSGVSQNFETITFDFPTGLAGGSVKGIVDSAGQSVGGSALVGVIYFNTPSTIQISVQRDTGLIPDSIGYYATFTCNYIIP